MTKVKKTKICLYFKKENTYGSHNSHKIQPVCLVYKVRTPYPKGGLYKSPFFTKGILLYDHQVISVGCFFQDIFNPTEDEYNIFKMLTAINTGNFLDELKENDWLSIL